MRKGKKTSNKYRMLCVSRQLSPELKSELFDLVQRAYTAEKNAGNPLGHTTAPVGVSIQNQQEYSCGNILQRSNE
jgi:hypothetical protein